MRMVALLVLAMGAVVAPPAACAAPDPFAEFRIPPHRTRSGSLGVDLSGGRSHQSSSRSDNGGGSARAAFAQDWDSDRLRYTIGIGATGSDGWDHRTAEIFPIPSGERVQRAQDALESWTLDMSLRSYPHGALVGVDLSVSVLGAYEQGWSSSREEVRPGGPAGLGEIDEYWSGVHAYDHHARLALAVGLGRVRDATVVYSVHVLEERLRDAGTLVRELSPAARERLAALFYVAPSLSTVHDRPDRYVWREVERVLREDGALSEGGLDAYSVLRGRERVEPTVNIPRPRGSFAGPVVTVLHSHRIVRADRRDSFRQYLADTIVYSSFGDFGTRETRSQDDVWVGGKAEFHRPLGWAWQFDVTGTATRPLWSDQQGLDLATATSTHWMIADRWMASASLGYARDYLGPRAGGTALQRDDWKASYAAELGYYLEDHVRISVVVSETQFAQRLGSTRWFQRDSRLQLGLTYRFLGDLAAPGLLEPVRAVR